MQRQRQLLTPQLYSLPFWEETVMVQIAKRTPQLDSLPFWEESPDCESTCIIFSHQQKRLLADKNCLPVLNERTTSSGEKMLATANRLAISIKRTKNFALAAAANEHGTANHSQASGLEPCKL